MKITTKNAHEFVGKLLHGGTGHYFPLKVIKHNNGKYYVIDRYHTMMPVPEPWEPELNHFYFEYATDDVQERSLPE